MPKVQGLIRYFFHRPQYPILALIVRKCNSLFKQQLKVPRAPCKACWKTRCRT